MPAALVTGVSRAAGIATEIARALGANGWDLALTGYPAYDATRPWGSDRDEVEALIGELRGAGVTAGWRAEDLGDPSAPARVFDAAETVTGPVTALVNTAAHSVRGGVLETSAADFDRHMAVNARATLLLTAEFVRRLTGPTGRVINFTSGPPLTGEVAYASSKGAIEWITVSSAAELAARGITVNAVDPGPNDTGWMEADQRVFLARRSPLGRLGTPADVAGFVVFLCSPEAGWISGQVLHCDGGWSTLRRD